VARFLAEGPPVTRMVCSPLRRTLQTAQPIAARLALAATVEERLRERMNWDGSMPVAQFLAEWDAATADRSFSPTVGDSSHQAGARFAAVLTDLADQAAPGDHVVVVTHGGVTIDGLRTLFGDDAVQAAWPTWRHGIPSAAITRIGVDAPGPRLIAVADAGHLHDLGGGHH
jgi:broad specificity phosphatase PhoE